PFQLTRLSMNQTAVRTPSAPGLLPTPPTKPRFRHLSEPKMEERREKSLCFNCDKKWSRQHRCGGRVFLLLADEDEGEVDQSQLESTIDIDTPSEEFPQAQLSLHALAGSQTTDTFWVMDRILHHPVHILVDGGSTHNFIQASVARSLGLHHSPTSSLRVMVGSGQELICTHWLKQLGHVLMDNHSLTMKFFHQGSCIELQEPTHLPPTRRTDHHITLVPNATPVNVRPYRCPHAQKTEIENQVAKMLKTGWIQPSTIPFSSPVLLLKKKDGTWRMCVDYRALNSITVRDRFPLPTIDELLDELGTTRIFSQLDLTSGFHQIRLASEDISKTAFRTHDDHYEYCVMPFGLCNAPTTFQATMNDMFHSMLWKTVIVATP
ncbi:hypothetical protein A2U01_0008140, partial [Trifolium medium]|nr:hypothetical protein [Trifolium medium]